MRNCLGQCSYSLSSILHADTDLSLNFETPLFPFPSAAVTDHLLKDDSVYATPSSLFLIYSLPETESLCWPNVETFTRDYISGTLVLILHIQFPSASCDQLEQWGLSYTITQEVQRRNQSTGPLLRIFQIDLVLASLM